MGAQRKYLAWGLGEERGLPGEEMSELRPKGPIGIRKRSSSCIPEGAAYAGPHPYPYGLLVQWRKKTHPQGVGSPEDI